jgi:hypothetical protein
MQDAQQWVTQYTNIGALRELENDTAVTLWEDGVPILCTGCMPYWENRAMVWSYVSKGVTRRNFLEIHNLGRQWIESLPHRRLEAYVDCDFEAGHRWAKAMGFEMETARMKAFQINGGDCAMYAKVKV